MKTKTTPLVLPMLLLGLVLSGCQSAQEKITGHDILFQYSTLGSLMEGVYDGDMTYADIKQRGDFGLGTFNALDGEMIEIDHQVYQIKADGIAYQVDDDMKAPFAVVTHFDADQTVKLQESVDFAQLKKRIDNLLPTENIPYAIKIAGLFSYVKTRSVPRQEKPYPRLSAVVENQPLFEFQEVKGVMVGFRLPDYMAVANAPGHHFHFITAERNAGGHVLECQVKNVEIAIDYTDQWHMNLPGDDAFYKANMSGEVFK